MTSVETLWARLKETAQSYVSRGPRLTHDAALFEVKRLIHEARVSPPPPPDIVEFYAVELERFVDELTATPHF